MENYKESQLFAIIKQEIDKIDGYSLLKSGCPKDEFDIEVKMIYDKLNKGMDEKQIATIMSNVLGEMFDDDFSIDVFIDCAKIIEKELHK